MKKEIQMQRMKRSAVSAAAAPILAVLLLSSCGGGSAGNGPGGVDTAIANVTDAQLKGTQITLARFFGDCTDQVGTTNTDVSKAVGECPAIQTLTNKFNAENKWGIKVTRLGGAAWDSYYLTLNAAIAGGNPPDVAIMHGSSLVDYAKRGLLLPVDNLVKITGVDLNDAVPSARTAIAYNGSDYAVPFDVHAALAHVNVDIFKQSGLVDASGNPMLPHSTDEFLADAAKVKQATGKNFLAIARSGDQLGVHLFESLVEQQGGDILNDQGTKATLDTQRSRNALSFMDKIFSGGFGIGNQTYDAAQQSFLNGNVAILFNGTWVVDQYRTTAKFNYEALNWPTLYSSPAVWGDNHTWTIPKQPKADPVKYRAALEFISFLYTNDKYWAMDTGHISVRKSVLNSAEYKAAPQRANYADTGLTVAHPVPHISNWPAVAHALVEAIESIWFQHQPVDQALKAGEASINAVLSQ